MNNPRVSIIIVNYNGEQDTIHCLDSLIKINYSNFEIIVVDNGSKHESVKKLSEWIDSTKFRFENFGGLFGSLRTNKIPLKLIKLKNNIGFAEGNNRAIRDVIKGKRSEYVLLLNNDTVVDKDFLKIMTDVMDDDIKIAAAGAHLLNLDKSTQSCGIDINWYLCTFDYHTKNKLPKIREVDFVSGAAIMLRYELLKEKLLPNQYFLYFEETAYCTEWKRKGYNIIAVRDSNVYHKESNSTNISGVKCYYSTRNRIWFMKRYATRIQYFVFLAFFIFLVLPKVIISHLNKSSELKMYLKGAIDGFKGEKK
jgi:GT2 family glycosyltransferase